MAASLPPLVLTGATGFVGGHVVEAMLAQEKGAERAPRSVTLIVRHPDGLSRFAPLPADWRVVQCDLSDATPPPGTIPSGSIVVHLAAATGRLAPAVMRAVNVDGTRRLVEAAVVAGAAHLVFVSSIAAGFGDRRWYHYANAKRDAEALVAASGLVHTIVRPTMVFGSTSPVQVGLQRLAAGRAPIVLGRGTVQVQPVHAKDLAGFLVALASVPPAESSTVEVGGADRVTLRELLARMRAASALPPREPWSVPLALPRLLLGLAEAVVGTRLPITAGQLASFVNDSSAASDPLVQRLMPAPRSLDKMLTEEVLIADAAKRSHDEIARGATPLSSNSPETLAHEFAVFARYLGSASPEARATEAYVRSHPSVAARPGDLFDRWLVSVARRSAWACGLAECYARVARPYGTLRRKLVLSLAVLESSPGVHGAYDTARASNPLLAWTALVATGFGWMARTAIAIVLLAPLQLVARFAGRKSAGG